MWRNMRWCDVTFWDAMPDSRRCDWMLQIPSEGTVIKGIHIVCVSVWRRDLKKLSADTLGTHKQKPPLISQVPMLPSNRKSINWPTVISCLDHILKEKNYRALKAELRGKETHLSSVFGASSALAVASCLPGWNYSYMLYWHAAVTRQRSSVTPTAFLSSDPRSCLWSTVPSTS